MPIIVHGSGGTSYNVGSAPLNPFGAPSMLDPTQEQPEILSPTGMKAQEVKKLIEENASKTGRNQRQIDADTARLMNMIMGPKPEAPVEDPFLRLHMRDSSHDPWLNRRTMNEIAANKADQTGYAAAQNARANALHAILSAQAQRYQTDVTKEGQDATNRRADAAEAAQKLAREKFEATQPSSALAAAKKAADEAEFMRSQGAAPLRVEDLVKGFSGQTDPLEAIHNLRNSEAAGRERAASVGLEGAAPKELSDILVALGQAGVPMKDFEEVVAPKRGAALRQAVAGRSPREQEIFNLINSLSPEQRKAFFPVTTKKNVIGQMIEAAAPYDPRGAGLVNSLIDMLQR